jgi:hypothetical protein
MPRLAVIDAAAVDGRRRLVLVRRDNVEHLIMIGGPSDLVVEPNIVRAVPPREPGLARPAVDVPNWADAEIPRAESLDNEHTPALPEMPPPRPARSAPPDDIRRAPPVAERRPADPLAGFIPEPVIRNEPAASRNEPALREPPMLREPMPRPRSEPLIPRAPARAAEPPLKTPPIRPAASPAADQNLAEMAHRLEAALRRPTNDARPEGSGSGTPAPASIDRIGAPPVAPEAPATRPMPPRPSRPETTSGETSAAPDETKTPEIKAPEVKPPAATAPTPKTSFKNLEDEMASLLGRPKTPS